MQRKRRIFVSVFSVAMANVMLAHASEWKSIMDDADQYAREYEEYTARCEKGSRSQGGMTRECHTELGRLDQELARLRSSRSTGAVTCEISRIIEANTFKAEGDGGFMLIDIFECVTQSEYKIRVGNYGSRCSGPRYTVTQEGIIQNYCFTEQLFRGDTVSVQGTAIGVRFTRAENGGIEPELQVNGWDSGEVNIKMLK